MFAGPSNGMPKHWILYLKASTKSVELSYATNLERKEDDSIVFRLLECQITRLLLTYNLCPTIYVQVFFSDFAGNARAQKPNKSQTNRASITDIQYFHGIWSFLQAHQVEWCQIFPIIYSLFVAIPHNFTNFPFTPLPS